MYSGGAINSTVAFLISGRRVGSAKVPDVGSQLKSSGTTKVIRIT